MKEEAKIMIIEPKILPVKLSGGSGTRLWPLSRAAFPKQYLNFEKNNEYTFLQNTFLRLRGTSKNHRRLNNNIMI